MSSPKVKGEKNTQSLQYFFQKTKKVRWPLNQKPKSWIWTLDFIHIFQVAWAFKLVFHIVVSYAQVPKEEGLWNILMLVNTDQREEWINHFLDCLTETVFKLVCIHWTRICMIASPRGKRNTNTVTIVEKISARAGTRDYFPEWWHHVYSPYTGMGPIRNCSIVEADEKYTCTQFMQDR